MPPRWLPFGRVAYRFPLARLAGDPPGRGRAARRPGEGRDEPRRDIATPRKRNRTPPAIERSRAAVSSSSLNIEWRAGAARGARGRQRSRARTTESRLREGRGLAHGGDRRHARRADGGEHPGDERDDDSDQQRDDHRPGREDAIAVGKSVPRLLKRSLIPFARNTPSASRPSDAMSPMTSDSRITDPRICRREAPTVRTSRTRVSAGRR